MYLCILTLCEPLFVFVGRSLMLSFITCTDIRRIRMLRQKLPGPYEDLVGPTVLCIMLVLSIVTQFAFKMFYADVYY